MKIAINTLFVAGTAIAGFASISAGAVVYEQNFESLNAGGLTAGAYNGVSLSGQDGYTATAAPIVKVVNIGGVGYSGGAINISGGSNAVRLDTWNPDEVGFARSFAPQSGDIYFSYTYSIVNFSADDFHWLTFGNVGTVGSSGTVNSSLGIASRADGGAAPGLYVRSRNGTSNTNGPAYALSANASTEATGTYFIVGKISKSATTYNQIQMWVNPTSTTETLAARSVVADTGLTSIGSFRFLLGGSSNQLDAGDSITLDNLRIGTTFAAVIPEPASLGLLGLATLAAGRRRRN